MVKSNSFIQGAITGLILAALAYLHTPIISSIVSGIGSILHGVTSTPFIYMPIVGGLIWMMFNN